MRLLLAALINIHGLFAETSALPDRQLASIIYQEDEHGNVVKEDPRGGLETKGPELGLTPDEILKVRQTTGYVACPGDKSHRPSQASAFLIGDGAQILTNAHVFIDELTGKPVLLSECYFQNQTVPWSKIPLDFRKGAYKLFSDHPKTDGPHDLAIVKLQKKVQDLNQRDVTPFPFDFTETKFLPFDKLIVISATQEKLPTLIPPTEPVIQECHVEFTHIHVGDSAVVVSDCSSTLGASGSVGLMRMNGTLTIKTILVGAGPEDAKDFQPFDFEKGEYGYLLGITSFVWDVIPQLKRGAAHK